VLKICSNCNYSCYCYFISYVSATRSSCVVILCTHLTFVQLYEVSKINCKLMHNIQVPEPMEGSLMRRIYSAYPGTGSVYAVIAKSGTLASAYVPAVSYACSTVYWTDSCVVLSEFVRCTFYEMQ
jgi:hypothetical protein